MDAMIVVDMQVGLLNDAPKHDLRAVIRRINQLAAMVRARSGKVVWIQHCGRAGDDFEPNKQGWSFLPELDRQQDDIVIAKTAAKEDDLMGIVLEAGADDLKDDGENWEIITDPSSFEAVVEAVKTAGIQPVSAEVGMIPQNYIKLEGQQASTMIRLLEALEEHDDVQSVHANFDIDQKLLEEVAG